MRHRPSETASTVDRSKTRTGLARRHHWGVILLALIGSAVTPRTALPQPAVAEMTIEELQAAMTSGRFSSVEIVEASLHGLSPRLDLWRGLWPELLEPLAHQAQHGLGLAWVVPHMGIAVAMGMGGCVVAIVRSEQAQQLLRNLEEQYYIPRNLDAAARVITPVGGLHTFAL